jgi:hypothetical protein
VDLLLASLTSEQVSEWIAAYDLGLWGELADDHRAGTVAAIVANQWKKKGETPVRPADLFPSLKVAGSPTRQTPQEMSRILERWAGRTGG